jgi:hypothetical protein
MVNSGLKTPTPPTSVLTHHHVSSHLVYLDKEHYDEEKEIRSWSYDQQQLNNSHTLQRRKECSNTNNILPNRTPRTRPLLAYYLGHGPYDVSWMWQHHNPMTPFDTFQRNTSIMGSGYLSSRYYDNPMVCDDRKRSNNGKLIPLEERSYKRHGCKFSPYNKTRDIAVDKKRNRNSRQSTN